MGQDQNIIQSTNLELFQLDETLSGPAGAGDCAAVNVALSASSDTAGTLTQFCPLQMAALPNWPEPDNILDLIALACP